MNDRGISRRDFLTAAAVGAPLALSRKALSGEGLPPVRAITTGPKHHWFGYYDKLQFSPGGRYVLGMEVDFEHRSPTPADVIRIGMVDLRDDDRWIELGTSSSWGWQQGCMLQWVPNTDSTIIWNDREGERFVARLLDLETGERRTLPNPVYALGPDGTFAVGTSFSRLDVMRPGYGYAGVPDPYADQRAPQDLGIYRMDLRTGETKLIVSLAEAASIPYEGRPTTGSWNWFNHLLVSPDGERLIFLHRWRDKLPPRGHGAGGGYDTRMFTASTRGGDLYVVDPYGDTSHFVWRDPEHIMAWARHPSHGRKFYLYRDRTDHVEVVAPDLMPENGHNTYLPILPVGRWVLNDTYPDENRIQHAYLYDTLTERRIPIGHFHSPEEYRGEWRTDLHPRSSRDGNTVCIDSTHEGMGRQLYLIDISEIVG